MPISSSQLASDGTVQHVSFRDLQYTIRPVFSLGEMMALIRTVVANELPKNYQVSWTDMSYQENQNSGKIVWILTLSLLMAYLFLVAQYESWTVPISVILSVARVAGVVGVRTFPEHLLSARLMAY